MLASPENPRVACWPSVAFTRIHTLAAVVHSGSFGATNSQECHLLFVDLHAMYIKAYSTMNVIYIIEIH